MKKLLMSIVALLAITMTAQAQEGFGAGVHVGLPVGDASDVTNLNLGGDISYLWNVADSFNAGITTGYTSWLTEDVTAGNQTVEVDNISFVPIAASGQYILDGGFNIGADLGYALGINDGNEGGFLYQPKVGYSFGESSNIYLGYKGISNDGDISAVALGVKFGLGGY